MNTSRQRKGIVGRRLTFVATLGAAALLTHCFADLDEFDREFGTDAGGSTGAGRSGAGGGVPGGSGAAGGNRGGSAGAGGQPPMAGAAGAGGLDGGGSAGAPAGGAGGVSVAMEPPKFDAESSKWCEEAKATFNDLEFCTDFDGQVAGVPGGFDLVETSAGTTLAVTSSQPSTKWNDLLVYAPPTPNGVGSFSTKLTRQFTNEPTSKFTLAFDLYPEQVTVAANTAALVAVVEFTKVEPKYSLRLVSFGGRLRLEESRLIPGTDVIHDGTTGFPLELNQWTRVELEVVLDAVGGGGGGPAAPPRARVSKGPGGGPPGRDGLTLVGTAELNVPDSIDRQQPTLLLGVAFGSVPHAGWALRYDNVLLAIERDAF